MFGTIKVGVIERVELAYLVMQQEEVDKIISEVEQALKSRKLPKWTPREDWQEKYPQYSSFT